MAIVLHKTIKQNLIMGILDIVINNIKNEMKKQNLKQHEFADKMGYGNVHMSNILRQKRGGADSLTFLEKAAKVLNIPMTSLLSLQQASEHFVHLYDLNGNLTYISLKTDLLKQLGQGEFFVEYMPDESMQPTIKMGDMLVIRKVASLSDSGIYIFKQNNNLIVKRVTIQLNNQIIVNVDSNLYPQSTLQKSELSATLLGNVVWLGRHLR